MLKQIVVALVSLITPAAFAQAYIAANGDCGTVTFHLERAAASGISDAYVFLPKQRLAVTPVDGAFKADVPENFVVMAGVDLKPEIRGDETVVEHAKAFTFCGATPAIDWQHSTGSALEIIPQGWNGPRPRMKRGDPMHFIALSPAENNYIHNLPMELYRAGGALVAKSVATNIGMASFPYPEPGRYTVVATYRRADPKQPEHWLVDTSTLTFDIK